MLGRGRRMRRRGLVAGAAIANHRRNVEQSNYQQGELDQAAQDQQYVAAQPAPPPPPAPAPAAPAPDPMDAKMAELEKLGRLHESGVLTDEEFAAEKAKILNS
jgi:hypothetical protein